MQTVTYLSKPLADHSTDTLIELLYWIADRRAYARACNIPAPAADNAFESAVRWELQTRKIKAPAALQH